MPSLTNSPGPAFFGRSMGIPLVWHNGGVNSPQLQPLLRSLPDLNRAENAHCQRVLHPNSNDGATVPVALRAAPLCSPGRTLPPDDPRGSEVVAGV